MADINELPDIPGLTAFLQTRRFVQDQAAREQQQGLQREFIQRRAALGENPTPEALIGLAQQYGSPQDLMHYGLQSQDRKEAIAQRLSQAQQNLDYRMEDLNRRRDEAGQRLTDQQDRNAFDRYYKNQSLLFQQSQAEINNELRRLGIEVQRQRADQQAGQQTNRQTQQLGTALERANLPEADATLRAAEEAMQKRPDLPEYMSGPKSLLPDVALPNDVTAGKQAFAKLFNITLKNRSGAAVTPPEFERLKQEFGTGVWKKPEQFVEALSQARNILSNHYRGVAAGFGPDTLDTYNQNLRESGGTPLLESQGATSTEQTPSPATMPAKVGTSLESAVKNSGWAYEPQKFDYRISGGKVQRKAKTLR